MFSGLCLVCGLENEIVLTEKLRKENCMNKVKEMYASPTIVVTKINLESGIAASSAKVYSTGDEDYQPAVEDWKVGNDETFTKDFEF